MCKKEGQILGDMFIPLQSIPFLSYHMMRKYVHHMFHNSYAQLELLSAPWRLLPISSAEPMEEDPIAQWSERHNFYKVGLTASLVVRLIGLLLVFASQKKIHNVRDEMAESVMLSRKETKDSLTRQGMQKIRVLHRKGLARREKRNEYFLVREHANKSWQWKRTCTSFCTAAQEHLPPWHMPVGV